MTSIALEHVTKQYGNVLALNDLSFVVEDGECCVILGPPGCGKSTLIRCLLGKEDITFGRVTIDGRDFTELASTERAIFPLWAPHWTRYPHIPVTLYDYIACDLRECGFPPDEIEQLVREVSERLDVEAELDKSNKEWSREVKLKARSARLSAIVNAANVLVADEPIAALDAKLRIPARGEIAKLHRRIQKTMIVTTSDVEDAMTMATQVAILKDGRLPQYDSPKALQDAPVNDVVVAGEGRSEGV